MESCELLVSVFRFKVSTQLTLLYWTTLDYTVLLLFLDMGNTW